MNTIVDWVKWAWPVAREAARIWVIMFVAIMFFMSLGWAVLLVGAWLGVPA